MTARDDFLDGAETHSVEKIAHACAQGLDPAGEIDGRTPVRWLIEMYLRSPRFSDCVRAVIEAGGHHPDDVLLAVLLDDPQRIRERLAASPGRLSAPLDLPCAFTPLVGASLLHVAAEFGLARAARELLDLGADIEATAALDEHGWGGQTPIFHTVNANANNGLAVLRLLIERGARTDLRLVGLHWGQGFEWETAIFEPGLRSYAQCGLLPQFHRDEMDIDATIRLLDEAAGRPHPVRNVPNAYLKGFDYFRSFKKG